QCRLQGFSTHYNFSFPAARKSKSRNPTKVAYLLAHILPAPVLLLAANRQSSAVGVRPRQTRLEVTADFTPDPALMLATCAFVAGVVETVLRWEEFGLRQLSRHGMPRLTPFRLRKHSWRRGRRMLRDSLGVSPFAADVSAPLWKLRDGPMLCRRAIAAESMTPFRQQIKRRREATCLQHID